MGFLEVRRGDVLLVHGGVGGVGSIAVQLAARLGSRVLATGSRDNQVCQSELGAQPLLYGKG